MKLDFHPESELELLEAAYRYDLEVPALASGLERRCIGFSTFCSSIPT
jgi:hypothetical protein